MPRQTTRELELLESILDAAVVIDTTDQSRVALSDGLDEVRSVLAEAYGPDFEEHLAERFEEGTDDDDDDDDDDEEDEDEAD